MVIAQYLGHTDPASDKRFPTANAYRSFGAPPPMACDFSIITCRIH